MNNTVDIIGNIVYLQSVMKDSSKIIIKGRYKEFDDIVNMGEDALPILMDNLDWMGWEGLSAIAYITGGSIKIPTKSKGKIDDIRKIYEDWYASLNHGTK